jgi:hypothetical protein
VPLPQLVNSDLCQLRNTLNVPESVPGEAAKLVLDGSDSFLEPDSGDWVSAAVYGSDADGNDLLPLGVGQLFVIERDDNNSHTPVQGNEKISMIVSRSLHAISLLIVETRYFKGRD